MPESPTRHRAALAIALVGVAVSAVTLAVHRRLVADSGYTSFCNLGDVVNCDLLLPSGYGLVLGEPVPVWGLLAFAVGAALALPGALGRAAGVPDLLLIALVWGSVGFALVLLVIMATVLHHACLLCLG